MTTRTRTPAAASAWVRALVSGAERPAAVVHVGADAVYLDVGGSCLGVMSSGATAVPCGLLTTLPAVDALVPAAGTVRVGAGHVSLGDHDVVPTRLVDASVPRLTGPQVDRAAWVLGPVLAERTAAAREELGDDPLDRLARGDAGAVPALLGRGSGLTPLGDDVLAGWLATAAAADALTTDAPAAALVAEVAARARAATTLLSATLLDCAARGDVLPQYRRVLLDLADPREPSPVASVDALVAVGHTSGAGLALGTELALRHLASRSAP